MKPSNLHRLIPVAVLLLIFGAGGWYVEAQRARQRSTLSGFVESQPTQVSSRIGGRVTRVLENDVDSVRAGQALVEPGEAYDPAETAAKVTALVKEANQWRGM